MISSSNWKEGREWFLERLVWMHRQELDVGCHSVAPHVGHGYLPSACHLIPAAC